MTVIQTSDQWVPIRHGSTTVGRGYERRQVPPVAVGNVVLVVDDQEPTDEQLARNYVSRLWAEDWSSDEDSIYDKW